MSLSHIEFNEQVTSFANDVSNAISALKNGDSVQVDAELASADSRLRAVVNAKVDLCSSSEPAVCLAELRVVYKLCVDSYSRWLAVEHSSFELKARVDRTPIIRWDYDRKSNHRPSAHVQINAHRGALSHILSKLDHDTNVSAFSQVPRSWVSIDVFWAAASAYGRNPLTRQGR